MSVFVHQLAVNFWQKLNIFSKIFSEIQEKKVRILYLKLWTGEESVVAYHTNGVKKNLKLFIKDEGKG